jgi:hypothetical protein
MTVNNEELDTAEKVLAHAFPWLAVQKPEPPPEPHGCPASDRRRLATLGKLDAAGMEPIT